MIENVLSITVNQVPPCTPASNAESPAVLGDRNNSNSSSGNTASDSSKSRMLNKRQSTTESAISASEVLSDSLLAGWDPEKEAAVEVGGGESNGGGSNNVIVENGDESGHLAKASVDKVAMPFSRIATNLDELHKVLSTVNVWGLNVFKASDFVVQKRVLTCVNFKIYQVKKMKSSTWPSFSNANPKSI